MDVLRDGVRMVEWGRKEYRHKQEGCATLEGLIINAGRGLIVGWVLRI